MPREERRSPEKARFAVGLTIEEDVMSADALELFACSYAGADHLPLERMRERSIAVTPTSDVHGPNVAEHAVGGILTSSATSPVRALQDRRPWRHFQADELKDSTVTVVGLGPIGRAIAEHVSAFGVETSGVRYNP